MIYAHTSVWIFTDCKYKCHQGCEDLLAERCTGPKRLPTDSEYDTADRAVSKSKHLHDAVSVINSYNVTM